MRGYELESHDEYYKLTDRSLGRPVKVFDAKWNKECDNSWEVKGKIPEGKWVIVYSNDKDTFYLVKSDDVEPKISTKKTEKKVVSKKAVTKKVPAKKAVKKVVKKK